MSHKIRQRLPAVAKGAGQMQLGHDVHRPSGVVLGEGRGCGASDSDSAMVAARDYGGVREAPEICSG